MYTKKLCTILTILIMLTATFPINGPDIANAQIPLEPMVTTTQIAISDLNCFIPNYSDGTYSTTTGGNVTDQGGDVVTARGVCYGTTAFPTTSGNIEPASTGGTGTFSITLNNLTSNTKYYYQAYATNSYATNYGNENFYFITIPFVISNPAGVVTENTVRMTGDVWSGGGEPISSKGFIYSTSESTREGLINNGIKVEHGNPGSTGAYYIDVSGLDSNTIYYYIAYATNATGSGYSNSVQSFKTNPITTTYAVTNLNANGATLNGNVAAGGGELLWERGFYYSATESTFMGLWSNASIIKDGGVYSGGVPLCNTPTGNYSKILASLSPNTTYHYMAYASSISAAGMQTGYGAILEFTTPVAAVIPNINTFNLDKTSLPSSGGTVVATVTGTSLDAATALQVSLDGGTTKIGNVSNNTATSAQITFSIPPNTSESNRTDTVSLFLNGEPTAYTATLIVNKHVNTPAGSIKDFTCNNIDNTTAVFGWSPAVSASEVKIEYSFDGGNWLNATHPLIDPAAKTATVTGLTQSTAYIFRLFVTGGNNAGQSNWVYTSTSPWGSVSGTVKDSDGNPIEGAYVTFFSDPSVGLTRIGQTQSLADGSYSMSKIPVGIGSVQGEADKKYYKMDVDYIIPVIDNTITTNDFVLEKYWASGYPKVGEAQPAGSKQVKLVVKTNVSFTMAYYVVVSENAPAPSESQIAAGTDSTGAAALAAGSGVLIEDTEIGVVTSVLPANSTAYDVYGVLKYGSSYWSEVIKLDVTTPPAEVIPVSSITVTDASGAASVIEGHTLQMNAAVLPTGATNKTVTWSVINGTGSAAINNTGLLTGTAVGTITVKAAANDASGVSGTQNITITSSSSGGGGSDSDSFGITWTNLPEGTPGKVFSHKFLAAGGSSPYKFKVTGGSLPRGLSMAEDGTFSGTPILPGTYIFTVTVTDNNGRTSSREFTYIVKLGPDQKLITLAIKSRQASIDGLPYTIDAEPFIDSSSNRTLVGIRFVSEALGSNVEWLPVARQVKIKDGDNEMLLTIGARNVLVNGLNVAIDSEAVILPPGRTFVPLRFISETLGATVDYDSISQTITIFR